MRIRFEKIILILAVFVSVLLTTSCEKNLSLSNPDVQKLSQKAQKLVNEGDFQGAIGRLESINDLNPNLAENHYNLGIAYYKNDQYEKAVSSLKKALDLNKELKDAYYTLAVIHEEIALEKTEELKETADNKEAKVNALIKITQHYKYAKDNFVSYLKFISLTPEREQILRKIKEFSEEIEKKSEQLADLGIKETE
jgi:tetratricopeptide (TPR) repeat protein